MLTDHLVSPRRTFVLELGTGALILAVAIAGLIWSWGTWPDALIDFGRELYVPWRLTQGAVLYRDIAYFHGPLSPSINSLLFLVFGVSLRTLVLANFAIMLAVVGLLYLIFRKLAGRPAACLACLTFLMLFAFCQYVGIGNYNWICPYSHEATHASALSLLSIYLFGCYWETGRVSWIAGAGVCLGLVFLTKIEFFAAAALATSVGMALLFAKRGIRPRRLAAHIGIWALCVVAIPGVAFAVLAAMMPLHRAAVGVVGGWAYVFDRSLTSNATYGWRMGTDILATRLWQIGVAVFWYGLSVAAALGIAICFRKDGRVARGFAGALLFAFAAALWFGRFWIPWYDLAVPWQVFLLGLTVWAIWKFWRTPSETANESSRLALLAMLAVYALGLLARMFFNVTIGHYGFVLAMPATLLLVVAVVVWIPRAASKLGGRAYVFRGLALVFLAFSVGAHLYLSDTYFRQKTFAVGSGADSFRADARGYFVARAMELLSSSPQQPKTLAALPYGITLNYLLRIPNPTPYVLFIPPDMQMHGEQNMLAALQRRPPDWIVLIHCDDTESGARFFGRDYGGAIGQWIAENYEAETLIGSMPFQDDRFGVLIARRKLRSETAPSGP